MERERERERERSYETPKPRNLFTEKKKKWCASIGRSTRVIVLKQNIRVKIVIL